MYLRFITRFIDNGKEKTGLFQAMYFLRDHPLTDDKEEAKLKELAFWFSENLEVPKFFNAPHPSWREPDRLSWFKDSAKEHIAKAHELRIILENHDLIVEIVTSKKPGFIVFEDEFQISAVPYSKKGKRVI